MIWQLMKLDVSWRFVKRQTILFCVLAAAWHLLIGKADDGDGPALTMLLMVFVPLFSVGFTPFVQPLDTRFQATLPVTVREIFVVRIVSTLALQWLPVLASATVLLILRDQPASGTTVRTWWVFTCIVLTGQCAGIRGLTMWNGLRLIAVPLAVFVINLIAFARDWTLQDSPAWSLAMICCWGFTAWVVARTWQTVGKSFELAPAEDRLADAAPIAVNPALKRGEHWKPVLQTLFPHWGIEYLVWFLAMCIAYSPILVFVFSGQGWTSMRTVVRWMLPLPIRRHALLAATVLPGMLSLICGYLVGVHLGFHLSFYPVLRADTRLRTQIVTLVFIAGWSMLTNLCALAGDWRIIRRVSPSRNWPAIFGSPIVGLGLVLFMFKVLGVLDPVLWLSAALPASLAGAIAVCLVPLAMLWWSLDAMFRRVEFADKPARGAA